MAKVKKVQLADDGHIRAMKDPKLRREMQRILDNIARAAGPGHKVEIEEGRTRLRGTVTAVTRQARQRESRDKVLTRAVQAGRQ